MAAPDLSGDRWLTITDQDRRGTILVIAIICCVYCPMLLALRAVTSFKNLGLDDYLAIAGKVTGIIQYVIVFAAVSNGLGETFDGITSSDALVLGRLTIASQVLSFITLCWTKCAVAMLCRKLFSVGMKKHIHLCDATAGLCVVWTLASILAVTVGCGPLGQIGFRVSFCSDLGSRWVGVAIADAITEILIFALSIAIVVPLKMPFQRKATVVLSFAPRLFIIVFSGLHAREVNHMVATSAPGTGLTTPTVYLQIQVIYGIVSAAVPALNRSLRMFNTSMGSSWWQTTFSQSNGKSGVSSSRKQNDIPLKSINTGTNRSRGRSTDRDEITDNEHGAKSTSDQVGYSFTSSGAQLGEADARSGRGQSEDSSDSKARIIRKETQWHISYETSG